MQKLLSFFSKLDYLVSVCSVIYGIYVKDPLYIVAGVFGFGLARYNLAKRVHTRLEAYLVKKKAVEDHSDMLKEHEALYEISKEAPSNQPADFSSLPTIVYKDIRALPSKHNILLKPGALDINMTLENNKI